MSYLNTAAQIAAHFTPKTDTKGGLKRPIYHIYPCDPYKETLLALPISLPTMRNPFERTTELSCVYPAETGVWGNKGNRYNKRVSISKLAHFGFVFIS